MEKVNFAEAPCRGKTKVFYPDFDTPKGERLTLERQAKQICASCPHRPECLEYGVHNEKYGIWGGANGKELKAIRKQRKIRIARTTFFAEAHPSCGSEKGYTWTVVNGIHCDDCQRAHEAFIEGHIILPGYLAPGEHPNCGTERGYQMLARRCRANGGAVAGYVVTCQVCKTAHAETSARLRRPRDRKKEETP